MQGVFRVERIVLHALLVLLALATALPAVAAPIDGDGERMAPSRSSAAPPEPPIGSDRASMVETVCPATSRWDCDPRRAVQAVLDAPVERGQVRRSTTRGEVGRDVTTAGGDGDSTASASLAGALAGAAVLIVVLCGSLRRARPTVQGGSRS